MQFHLISIFPQYFDVLKLSLLGRATQAGFLQWRAHDLRDYAEGNYRAVDDAPYGGGAGALMRPDVWGRAIDAALEECREEPAANTGSAAALDTANTPALAGTGGADLAGVPTATPQTVAADLVLAIPTPSGTMLTQAKVRELAQRRAIVVACGRYEGIDSRVAQYYSTQPGVEVFEFSLGDYVLNGGEVAALALVEAVGRLCEGVLGNPGSLVEESHEGAGLLEYPSYTRPVQWRGLEVPPVLQGGNHANIEDWRRMQALAQTIARRPDKLGQLDAGQLTKPQREMLARAGWVYLPAGEAVVASAGLGESPELRPFRVVIRPPLRGEAVALARLGSETFPLACPDFVTPEQIAQFTAEEFDLDRMRARLEDPQRHRYLVAEVAGELVGYTHAIVGMDDQAAAAAGISPGDAYLSKCYVRQDFHGTGLSGALLGEALVDLALQNVTAVSLGTSIYNKRAQKFYRHHGFHKVGTRTFDVGGQPNRDVVMRRVL